MSMEPYFRNELSTLYQGDCEEALAQMALDGVRVDKVITSPPYNTQRNQWDTKYDIHQDGMSNEDYVAWMVRVIEAIDKVLNKDGCILWNMSYGNENPEAMIYTINGILTRTRFTMADVIVWKKDATRPNNQSHNKFTRICEFVFVLCRRSEYDTFTTNKRVKSVRDGTGQRMYENIFNFFSAPNGKSINENHSTFSVEFVQELVRRYVRDGDSVLDPFSGTGTTMVACEAKGIRGFYSELSGAQCEYSVRRLRNLADSSNYGNGFVQGGLLDD